jgi:anti-sigma factor RsiW
MIDFETQLKVQSYLDRELDAGQAKEMADFLAKGSEAHRLLEELKATRVLLSGNEPSVSVPESREFYWSKIARAIEHQATPVRREHRRSPVSWWGWLVPVSAAAMLVLILSSGGQFGSGLHSRTGTAAEAPEIDSPLDDASVISFHSATEGMMVVWISSY